MFIKLKTDRSVTCHSKGCRNTQLNDTQHNDTHNKHLTMAHIFGLFYYLG
jgi:hypothetical protein